MYFYDCRGSCNLEGRVSCVHVVHIFWSFVLDVLVMLFLAIFYCVPIFILSIYGDLF